MNELQRILHAFDQTQQAGKQAVLATVVRTSGSVYRRPGTRMLITEDGRMVSAISGGCLEADILERSRALLAQGKPPLLVRYDTTADDDIVFGLGLGCNGIVDVLIEPLTDQGTFQYFAFMHECLLKQHTGAIATVFAVDNVPDVNVGDRVMMNFDAPIINQITQPNIAQRVALDTQKTLIEQRTRTQSYTFANGQIAVLLEVLRLPIWLLIFGAGYDAIPVVQLAKQLGWHVTVIDHRPAQLTRDRFPLADHLLQCDPNQPMSYCHLITPQTVAVVMSHHYLTDLAFLKTLIPAQLRYLGVLGPKRRMQKLWQDLAEHGIRLNLEQHQQLYNPIGLDIGAETPEEIALAIVAEIQAVLSGRSGHSLRDRPGSIHSASESCLELAS